MFCSIGCAKNEFKYSKYSNSNPLLNFSIDYPDGWKYIEYKDQQSGFPVAMFMPADTGGVFTVFASVEVVGPGAPGGKEPSVTSVADDTVSREMKLPDAKLLGRSKASINFAQAEDINISYKMLERLHVKGAKVLPSQTHIVVLKKGDKIYVAKLMSKQEIFDRYDRAFGHMVRTLKQVK